MGGAPVGVDILTEIPGIDFEAAWQRRVEDVIDETTGLKANFISSDDLIASKQAADLADVGAIQKAQHLRSRERGRPGTASTGNRLKA
jgi:Lon protease-like protein